MSTDQMMTDQEIIDAIKVLLVQSRNGFHVSLSDVTRAANALDEVAKALEKCSMKIGSE